MKIAILGLGYVGLPLAIQFARANVTVLGLDIDAAKVDSINQGRSYIKHIASGAIEEIVKQDKLSASTDFKRVSEVEAVIICVPTPLSRNREPDLSFILDTGRTIAPHLSNGALIVLESTTYPGTTDEDLRAVLEKGSNLQAGVDFHLAFSPEREDPANEQSKVKLIPKVVGGYTPACLGRAVTLYSKTIDKVVPVSSCRVAEATKLLENIFRSVNIALVNELKIVYGAMGIDIWEVIEAAKTKPFGFMPFYPGPGLGGHCIPLDPFYLAWKVAEFGTWTRFIELAGEINTYMPRYVVERAAQALNDESKALKGSRVLVLGLAYKGNIDDDRESPSYELIRLFREAGAEVDYCDPLFPVARKGRKHDLGLTSVACNAKVFSRYDAVVVATAHDVFRDRELYRDVNLVVDARNVVAPLVTRGGTGPRRLVK